ncbi:DUF6042 family protein [Streptomyces sp. NPDC006610]|uniref:DUF6042 family protein n=1 Tax=Streptomyces sp. NPDC006610 TaxID=3154584 RepID=UPI0033B68E6A
MHNDWWASGWEHVLPRQGFPLTMLIGTTSQPGFTGSWSATPVPTCPLACQAWSVHP